MKRLNKKGFTLVELLAVIVIMAILIATVAGIALPAMANAKQKALDTYGQRLCEAAQQKCMTDYMVDPDATCSYSSITDIMDKDNKEYEIGDAIALTPSASGASFTAGTVESKDSSLTPYPCS